MKKHIKSKHPERLPTDDELKGQFFFIDEKGSPLSLNAKLEKITQLEMLLEQEMVKNEELNAVYRREAPMQKPLADETALVINEVEDTEAGGSNSKAAKSAAIKTKAAIKDFTDLNSSSKKTRLCTSSNVEKDWSKEEDRILLERLKNGMDCDIQLENRTEREINSRFDFLTNFVKNLKKLKKENN